MESSQQHQEEPKSGTLSTHARTENKRLKEGATHTIKDQVVRIGGDLKFEKNPKYIEERKKVFDELYEAQCNKYKGKFAFH